MTKYGCLTNSLNQSQRGTQNNFPRKANTKPKQSKMRDRTAIDCLKNVQISCSNYIATENKITMDARTIDNLEQVTLQRKQDTFLQDGGTSLSPEPIDSPVAAGKKYHEPKFIKNERRVIEEQLQQAIRNIADRRQQEEAGGCFNRKVEGKNEQWTVDPFWDVDRPQAPVNPKDRPGPSTMNPPSTQQQPTPIEEGEIDSESDQDPSVLEVPAVNWAKYVGANI